MSKASEYGAMMAAGRKVKPPDFVLRGDWFAKLNDAGELVIAPRLTNMTVEEVARFMRWLRDVFDEP